ncbi:MAG: hypothetical protein NTX29_06185 [Actinobacteria bacterium]|nr:hypothetical protein [Actinomycetota bacterium]
MTKRVWAVSALLLAVLSIGACGTPRVPVGDADDTAAPSPAMMPTPNAFVSAVMHTRDLGSADVDITVDTSLDGSTDHVDGIGAVALDRGFGNIAWTGADGTTRVINNDVAIFVRDDVAGGMWTRLPEGQLEPRTAFANPLAGLGLLQNVVSADAEAIDGSHATRYSGRLPADQQALSAFGLTDEEITRLGDTSRAPGIDVTAWVDDAGRLLRVDRAFRLPAESGTSADLRVSTALSDFSGVIDVGPPPSESVTSASASASANS